MVKRSIVLDHFKNLEASALVVDGVLQDFFIESDIPAPGRFTERLLIDLLRDKAVIFLKLRTALHFCGRVKV